VKSWNPIPEDKEKKDRAMWKDRQEQQAINKAHLAVLLPAPSLFNPFWKSHTNRNVQMILPSTTYSITPRSNHYPPIGTTQNKKNYWRKRQPNQKAFTRHHSTPHNMGFFGCTKNTCHIQKQGKQQQQILTCVPTNENQAGRCCGCSNNSLLTHIASSLFLTLPLPVMGNS